MFALMRAWLHSNVNFESLRETSEQSHTDRKAWSRKLKKYVIRHRLSRTYERTHAAMRYSWGELDSDAVKELGVKGDLRSGYDRELLE
jgi:hypothetical protein